MVPNSKAPLQEEFLRKPYQGMLGRNTPKHKQAHTYLHTSKQACTHTHAHPNVHTHPFAPINKVLTYIKFVFLLPTTVDFRSSFLFFPSNS